MCPRSNYRRIPVLVDSNDCRWLQADVDGKTQRCERDRAENESQYHGAVGVGAQHPVVFIVFGARTNLCDSLLHTQGPIHDVNSSVSQRWPAASHKCSLWFSSA